MKSITRSLLLAVFMLALANVYAQKGGGDNTLKKKIQAYNNQIVKAVLENDNEKSLSFYTESAISLPNYGKMLRGIEEISQHQQEAEAMGSKVTAMTLTSKKINEYGDALVEIGVFTITLEIQGMPQPVSDEGKYVTVWEKQEDGSFKIATEIWNSDVNPMARMKGAKGGNPNSEQSPKLENSKGGSTQSSEKAPTTEEKKK